MPVQCKKMKKPSLATVGGVLWMKTIYNHASTFVRLYLSSTMLDYPTNTLTCRNSSIKKSSILWINFHEAMMLKNAPARSHYSPILLSAANMVDMQFDSTKVQHHCNAVTDHFLLPLKEYFGIFAGLIWATFCALLWPRFPWRVSGLWIDGYTFWWFTKQAKTINYKYGV